MAYSRYKSFISSGSWKKVPFIPIPEKNSDIYTYYTNTRLDVLSYKYYDNPNYGWLILQANPELGSLEFKIPQNSLIRIPYPLETTLNQYAIDIENYNTLYGLE